jgi:hypothetical protein
MGRRAFWADFGPMHHGEGRVHLSGGREWRAAQQRFNVRIDCTVAILSRFAIGASFRGTAVL